MPETNPASDGKDTNASRSRLLAALVKPSGPAAAVTLGVFGTWMTLACLLLQPHVLLKTTSPGMLITRPTDDAPIASRKLLQLINRKAPPWTLLILGSSDTRESIESLEVLKSEMSDELQRPVEVEMIYLDAMTPYEVCLILDQLNSGFEGMIVLGVNSQMAGQSPFKTKQTLAFERLPFTSEAARTDAAKADIHLPAPYGWALLDHRQFILRSLGQLAQRMTTPPQAHHRKRSNILYKTIDFDTQEGRAWARQLARRQYSGAHRHVENNFQMIRSAVRRLHDRADRARVVFMTPPANPFAYQALTEELKRAVSETHTAYQKALVAQPNPAIDPAARLSFDKDDFVDSMHLASSKSRVAFQKALLEDLLQVIHTGAMP